MPEDEFFTYNLGCILTHTARASHLINSASESVIQSHVVLCTPLTDVNTVVCSCVHCRSRVWRINVHAVIVSALYATAKSVLVESNHMKVAHPGSGEKQLLMLRDDHSNYCWLFLFPYTMAESAALEIIDWSAVFGVTNSVMFNSPTHLKTEHSLCGKVSTCSSSFNSTIQTTK